MMRTADWLAAKRVRPAVIAVLGLSCVGPPALLLMDRGSAVPAFVPPTSASAITPAPALAPGRAIPRLLFGRAAPIEAGVDMVADPLARDPAAPPKLIGIVGRLPDDAVALVRGDDGRSRTLAIGETAAGWRLDALAVDAVLFVRGGERVRVGLPATSN